MYFTNIAIRTPCFCFLASSFFDFFFSSLSPNCRIQEQGNLDCFLRDPLNLCLWVVTPVLIRWQLSCCLVLSQHSSLCGQRSPPRAEPLDGASVWNLSAKNHRSASWSAAGVTVTWWVNKQTFSPVIAQSVGDWAEKGRVLCLTPIVDKTWCSGRRGRCQKTFKALSRCHCARHQPTNAHKGP